MEVIIEGVRIELTESQLARIEEKRKEREACRDSFVKMLKFFEFEEMPDLPNCFIHKIYNWYAEYLEGNCGYVWITGEKLKTSAFPGGWIYWEPEEVEEALLKALEELEGWIKL